MTLPLVMLAGGKATRLGAAATAVPKILVDVAGRPFAEHQLELLGRQGIEHVVFCIGHLGDQVERALGDGRRWGMRFEYVSDGPILVGTGGAVRRALPLAGPAFFVMYGDSYLRCDFRDVEARFVASGAPGLMTVYRNEDRFDRSNVEYEQGRIVRYDKVHRTAAMCHIDYGLGVLTPGAFAPWMDDSRPFDLAAVYQRLVEDRALAGYEVAERFYEIGSPDGLAEMRALARARQDPPNELRASASE